MAPPLPCPTKLSALLISPSGQRAVAYEGDAPVLVDLLSLARTPLPGATRADLFVWSPLGTSLLLADRTSGQIRTYRLQGNRFEFFQETNLPADQYAISDDGTSLLAATASDLLLQTADGTRVLSPRTLTFTFLARTNTPVFRNGEDLVSGATRLGPLMADLLLSPAPGKLLAVDRESGKLSWLDDQGQPLAEANCNCVIDRLESLGTAGTLKLVTGSPGPTWLTETSLTQNRLFFVPTPEVAQ